ncbi:PARP domain containing protein [Asbolus verrucosus]|uniref:Poly [ADP-ribose] polymerase n=1 Tax=Asbolus verrucosus TaxID=1661398 RepID=A0A482W3H6_ASBVE|nr:PARP domain containing protein [Asbolus verrucosus]
MHTKRQHAIDHFGDIKIRKLEVKEQISYDDSEKSELNFDTEDEESQSDQFNNNDGTMPHNDNVNLEENDIVTNIDHTEVIEKTLGILGNTPLDNDSGTAPYNDNINVEENDIDANIDHTEVTEKTLGVFDNTLDNDSETAPHNSNINVEENDIDANIDHTEVTEKILGVFDNTPLDKDSETAPHNCNINVEENDVDRKIVHAEVIEESLLISEQPNITSLEQEADAESLSNDNFTKSEPNDELIKAVLQHPMTSGWGNESHKPYTLNKLLPESLEYQSVRDLFIETRHPSMNIVNIERVENPYLLASYLLKKDKMERNNPTTKERSLFHGTREMYIDGICKYNFDWRRRGQSRGHKFGQGVSFSPKTSYSRHYTHGENVMFLVKVLVGAVTAGNYETVIPPKGFDTTRNHDGNVIVKYEDDDFYPQYVIHYSF